MKKSWRALLIVPAVALGVIVMLVMVKNKKGPQKAEIQERQRTVRVLAAPELAVLPRAIGYGFVQPELTWEGIAEVGGKIVERHPELRDGAIIAPGDVLFRIDPAEYDLAEKRDEADVTNTQAKLRELEQKEKNLKRVLMVERRSLTISETELKRRRKLAAQGTISKSEVDLEEQRFLSQKNKVHDLENSINLVPSEREALLATLTSGESRLKDTRLDIGKTVIKAPFACRVMEVNGEVSQYAAPGQVLVRAYDIGVAEVLAHVPLNSFKNLLPQNSESPQPIASADGFSMEKLRSLLSLQPVVRLAFDQGILEWKARFTRLGQEFDPQTRTLGVYVAVDKPYEMARPGVRPPLIKNMYCQVVLYGPQRPKSVVVPRSALHGDVVYVVNKGNRLERRKVRVEYKAGNIVSLKEGVKPGELVVLTDLLPAVDGMLLKAQPDEARLKALVEEATGAGAVE